MSTEVHQPAAATAVALREINEGCVGVHFPTVGWAI